MTRDPETYLKATAELPDEDIDVARASVALAALKRPGLSMEPYFRHISAIADQVGERHAALIDAQADDTAETCLAALKHVLADNHGYRGDEDPDRVFHALDMIDVIDNRRGAPISLSILYLQAGRMRGWDIAGITIPGHFVLRIEKDGRRVVFDPSQQCRILQAADLRAFVKGTLGEDAELSADYYDPPSMIDILKRQQNTVKLRQVEMEDYAGALETVESLKLIDPEEHRLYLDAGVLYARTGQPQKAIDSLEAFMDHAADPASREDAAMLLRHLRENLE